MTSNNPLQISTLFNISGKTAVVTGGNDGIGKMIATSLIANGVNVYIVARKAQKNQAAAEELSLIGPGKCFSITADLSNLEDIERLSSELSEREPDGINFLINNAGTTWGAPINEFPEKGWDRVFNLNLKGTFYLTEALVPLLIQRAENADWSRIINLSSVGARLIDGDIASPAYASSKAGVEQLTRILAKSHGVDKITVNCIAPGWFPTQMTGSVEWAAEEFRKNTQLKRFGGTEDIGGLVIFLCSRAGSYLTGQIIDIDGGRTL